jgi:hypothetical protein
MRRMITSALLLSVALSSGIALASRFGADLFTDKAGNGTPTFPNGLNIPSGTGVGGIGHVNSGTYSATLVAGTNVAALTTPATLHFMRLGGSVIVYGQVSVDPTSDNTVSALTISLPVEPASNFSGTGAASGTIGINAPEMGPVKSTNGAKTVTATFYAEGTAVQLHNVFFVYDL